jgi:outer membrane protein assembly factor BamB
MKRTSVLVSSVLPLLVLMVTPVRAADQTPWKDAHEILAAAGVKGGLVVHVGGGDGRLTAALRAGDAFVVHGLDRDGAKVEEAREFLRGQGLYGPVSVERWPHSFLPYAAGTVNLVVAEDLGDIPWSEVMRVLCPNGAVGLRKEGRWVWTVKPRPRQIDEWTHFLHDATNNAVSDDSVVGPPRQLQWVTGPEWARSHDHLATISALVSSGGRVFSIVDEGPTAAVVLEPQWYLVARDAFNGVQLWQRPIPGWQWHLRGFRSGPSDLSRRLVAVGDRVYAPLEGDGPLAALEAATGRTVRTYDQTEGTLEVLCDQGVLYVVAGAVAPRPKDNAPAPHPGFAVVRHQRPDYLEEPPRKRIVVLDSESGRVLWTRSGADTEELMPTTLAVGKGRVFFQNADDIICIEAKSGADLWRAKRAVSRSRPTWSAPTLVAYGDVVLSADRAVAPEKTLDKTGKHAVEWIVTSAGGQSPPGELIAFSAQDGHRLWSGPCRECYNAPVDVLVAGGLVWTGDIVTGKDPGFTAGRDPRTGEVKRTRPKDQEFFTCGMGHQRCYRNKATNEYLVIGRSGVEFIDVQTGQPVPNHWIRGTCQYGVMPCNGLLYVPSNSCACFITAKLNGFNCLTSQRDPGGQDGPRLEPGPAYAPETEPSATATEAGDWPTYRHDAARSGHASAVVASDLHPAWTQRLGGRLSGVVVAEGKLFVAQVDTHAVHALEARTGRPLWTYTAGGRVDSPPTVWQGRVLFGSADGWVYCLRASDGALAWRFRAAPQERRVVAYGQLESLWPVSGSVLVRDGVVYCAAGRSSYLDGGLRLCRLEASTGKLLSETVVDDRDPQTGFQKKDVVQGTNMPGALPDVLSSDGASVFMRHQRFDLAGQPQKGDVNHLFSAAGFLDATWWHRTYWLIGSGMATNYGGWPDMGSRVPAGRLLVVDGPTVYGFGRNQYLHTGAHVGIDAETVYHYRPNTDADKRFTYYQAFAIAKGAPPAEGPAKPHPAKGAQKQNNASGTGKQYRWTGPLPVLARAMVLAGDTLFFAGPPDIFTSDDPLGAWEGRKGGMLLAVSAQDGKTLATCKLDSPPVFDGMAAANGRLYLATLDGRIVCLSD